MSLIVQRARVRVRRTGPTFGPIPLSIVIAGRSALATAAPVLNRPLRRLSGRRNVIAAASVPIVAAAVIALNLLGPAAQPHYSSRVAAEPVSAASSASNTHTGSSPGLPSGLRLPSLNDQATPRLAAVLAADIWQAGNAVYQAQTQQQIAAAATPAAPTPPAQQRSGPSLNDLIQAQIRLAMAQIVVQEVQQPQSTAALQQAQQAVADAQRQITEAQNQIAQTQRLLDQNRVAAQATPAPEAAATPSPESHAFDLAAAQEAVTRAQSALTVAERPYSAAQIAAAQTELISRQQALAAAQARAQAAVSVRLPAPTAQPLPVTVAAPPPTVAPVAATVVATVAPVAVATVQPAVSPPGAPASGGQAATAVTLPDGTLAVVGGVGGGGGSAGGGQPAASVTLADGTTAVFGGVGGSTGGDSFVQGQPSPATIAPVALPGATAEASAAVAAAAPPIATVAPAPVSTVAPAAVLPPAATPAPAPAATAPAASVEFAGTRAAPSAEIAALQQQVDQAQATFNLYIAPPDPATVQKAQGDLTAAQRRLDALTAPADATTAPVVAAATAPLASATAEPAVDANSQADPASAAAVAPNTAPESMEAVQQRYDQAKQWLAALTVGPDPETVRAAQAELQAAQHDYDTLLAQADSSVTAQLDPDPQAALVKYGGAGELLPARPDAKAFTWPAHGPITSFFGPGHPLGIDIAQGLGGPVTAAASGVVSFSGGDACCSYGYFIDVIHPGGYMTRYGHLLAPSFLKPGARVTQGQILGVSGSTGFSTGPHLHFEIRLNGVPLDPLKLIFGAVIVPRLPG